MACGCGDSACSCLIVQGDGIVITGSGTPTNPYRISSSLANLIGALTVKDTDSVDMQLRGSGTIPDPFVISAISTLKVTDLKDVADPSGGPAVGESLVWVGTGPAGHWEFGTLPPAPAGAVNVANGIGGVGSVGSPITLKTSGVWGSGTLAGLGGDSTIGDAIYIDSAGNARSAPSGSVAWTGITGKPTTFPPAPHTHIASDITDPLNLNVGKINNVKITTQFTSSSLPTSGTTAGDLVFFPQGS